MPPARILLVDDNAEVLSLAGRVLTNQGYNVLEASDGKKALAICREVNGEIDLLVTDIKMPGMDGFALAGSLTASYPAIRVLLISGHCEESRIQEIISQQGFGFLSKPFMPQLLIEAVK